MALLNIPNPDQDASPQWFAAFVKPRHEKRVAASLKAKHIEHFLPLRRVRTRWTDRWKELQLPLFPGYIFCRFDPNEPSTVVTTPGIISIVRRGATYARVRTEEIQLLQRAISASLDVESSDQCLSGTRVIIVAGPLSGITGTVVMHRSSLRLILSLTLLKRVVLAELDSEWISPV